MPPAEDDSPRTRRLLRLGGDSNGDPSERFARSLFRRSPLVLYRGGSWRLSPDGSLKRWDAVAQRWESIRKGLWSSDEATVVDDPDDDVTPESVDLANDYNVWSSVPGCTFVGGTLDELCVYGKYTIVFGRHAVTLLSRQAGVVEIPCSEVLSVEIGGRGKVGDGAVGTERFAFERAVDEMATTAVVKSLVARAGMDTSIRIETRKGESYFHCDCATPDEVRAPLEPFLAGIRRRRAAESSPEGVSLIKLADLRLRGLLTEEEFATGVATVFEGD